MRCVKCSFLGAKAQRAAHYHIVLKAGNVISVAFLSMTGSWDRELEPDEYVVLCEDTEPSYEEYED